MFDVRRLSTKANGGNNSTQRVAYGICAQSTNHELSTIDQFNNTMPKASLGDNSLTCFNCFAYTTVFVQ